MEYIAAIACPSCKKRAKLQLTDQQYRELESWVVNGHGFIQEALPSWSSAEREVLMTGIDSECWNKMMSEEEY